MNRHRKASSGFTLLEVLVASAVLAMVLVILLGSVTTSLSIWRNTEASMAADREGRSAFQMLADDLANAVLPTNPNLWPQIRSNGAWIGFLTLKPADYQGGSGDVGDICYVEYSVLPQAGSNALVRGFVGSRDTYTALQAGNLPSGATPQLLAANIVTNATALKGTAVVKSSVAADVNAVRTNFTALVFSNGVYSATGSANQRPDAIQVSLGAADMDTLRNPTLLANSNIPLRGGGFFTFTVNLPQP